MPTYRIVYQATTTAAEDEDIEAAAYSTDKDWVTFFDAKGSNKVFSSPSKDVLSVRVTKA